MDLIIVLSSVPAGLFVLICLFCLVKWRCNKWQNKRGDKNYNHMSSDNLMMSSVFSLDSIDDDDDDDDEINQKRSSLICWYDKNLII